MTADEILKKVKLSMTRAEVVAALGEPDQKSTTTRKYRIPFIYKYGDTELTFEDGEEGGLYRITKTTACWACDCVNRIEVPYCSNCQRRLT